MRIYIYIYIYIHIAVDIVTYKDINLYLTEYLNVDPLFWKEKKESKLFPKG